MQAIKLGAVFLLTAVTAGICLTPVQVSAQQLDAPVARIDGEQIDLGTLMMAEGALIYGGTDPEIVKREYQNIVQSLVDKALLRREAKRIKLDQGPEFERNLQEIRGNLLEKMLINHMLATAVSDARVKEEYNKLSKDTSFRTDIRLSHILVDTEASAQDVISALKRGANFAELAREKSLDPGSARRGGELGFVRKGEMTPPFEKAAFALAQGATSETPVKTEQGFHVIHRGESRTRDLPPFEEIQKNLKESLVRNHIRSMLVEFRNNSKIEILPRPE